jgi:hypothetical protein
MDQSLHRSTGPTRRGFLAAGAAVIATGASTRSTSSRAAVVTQPPGPAVRKSLSDPASAPALHSYQTAIAAMLRLPPDNPLNWYRLAFTHYFDCPHQNWWFLAWHRGYLGWFEQTCRTFSGDASFALPYWDWTADVAIPDAFNADTTLNPSNSAYIADFPTLRGQFGGPLNDFYASLSPAQRAQLPMRGLTTPAAFWQRAAQAFQGGDQARQPNFDGSVQVAVSLDTIQSALGATDFASFASDPASAHSQRVGEGILETYPHDNIHGAVGGLMGAFLSPIDPLFYMHHANIDRLWDVWTRKQQASGLPTLPTDDDLATWNAEPFLFFVGPDGRPASKTTAGDYAAIGDFNYAYQPGSGEAPAVVADRDLMPKNNFNATLSRDFVDFQEPTRGDVSMPADLIRSALKPNGPQLVARVKLRLPGDHSGLRFHVLLNPPAGARNVRYGQAGYVGTITPFGHGHGPDDAGHPLTPSGFTLPLNAALRRLNAKGTLKADEPLHLAISPDTHGATLTPFRTPLASIAVRVL